ncbi:hypothetical protein MTY_1105 [Moorella thermoacetica Y72]|uniref:Uncharacterized protein n=1 Tax=Moorella thermoacetica Y72 TaxID=1325331 RepID=A0A0S6UCV2_NEOTH|nr:hypothetical protein MTY_1105 [Moorella thermoacetica Y72]
MIQAGRLPALQSGIANAILALFIKVPDEMVE